MATTEDRDLTAFGTQYKMLTAGRQFPNRDKNRKPPA